MTDITHVGQGDPQTRSFKQIGTTAAGDPILAEYIALEPGSIGGGGGGVAGSVTIADGTTATQKAAIDATGRLKVDGSSVTQPVSGTFWQATQPVSGSVSITNFPGVQPVSGTFFQATQPVSSTQLPVALAASGGLKVDGSAVTQPVSGTFWQATQPVSGAVTVSNFPATQPVSGTFFQATQPVSGTVSISNFPASQAVTGTFFQATQPVSEASLDAAIAAQGAVVPANVVVLGIRNSAGNADRLQGISDNADAVATTAGGAVLRALAEGMVFNGTSWDRARGDATNGARVQQPASNLAVTATGVAAAAVTLTLPAPGAGLFHYITSIQIVKFATALLTAAATPVLVTTTNLPGSPVYSFSAAASAAGTDEVQQITPATPLKSSVAATATTIVGPATTATIWRINVTYYTGP